MTADSQQAARRRVLMTIDAVGGVWRYAMDLASGLRKKGIDTVFAGFGPKPSSMQAQEAQAVGKLVWCDAPLDWMVEAEADLALVPQIIGDLARNERVDLVHINLPSQAVDLTLDIPVVVVSHSCVATWFKAVRGCAVPDPWRWQVRRNREGFANADVVLSPSYSHAALLREVYGSVRGIKIVYNSSRVPEGTSVKKNIVFAAGRWWDEGKNGATLDAAAALVDWPIVAAGAAEGPNGQRLTFGHARLRGELAHADSMALMAEAAIVVSPSLYEPFGLAALEGARGRSALVLADIPTYRELWEGAALFADPRDPHAFAEAINRLSRDESLRNTLAAHAHARSMEFTTEAQVKSVAHVYGQLLPTNVSLTAAE